MPRSLASPSKPTSRSVDGRTPIGFCLHACAISKAMISKSTYIFFRANYDSIFKSMEYLNYVHSSQSSETAGKECLAGVLGTSAQVYKVAPSTPPFMQHPRKFLETRGLCRRKMNHSNQASGVPLHSRHRRGVHADFCLAQSTTVVSYSGTNLWWGSYAQRLKWIIHRCVAEHVTAR